MAAKRLGSALTNITGVAGQVLKVKSDESGFEFVSPSTIPAYTVTNKTVDRAINADDVTLDEVADVLATLIDDLSSLGAAGTTPQTTYISSTYQHTNSNSGTVYTLNHNFGSIPDLIVCQAYINSVWVNLSDYWYSPSNNSYGFQVRSDSTINSAKVTLYRGVYCAHGSGSSEEIPNGSDIRWLCFKLGMASQITPFQWSTSEQVYPFEKAVDGSTLYCKQVNLGALPNNGIKSVDLNLGSDIGSKTHSYYAAAYSTSGTNYAMLGIPNFGTYDLNFQVYQQYARIQSTIDFSAWDISYIRIIYKK